MLWPSGARSAAAALVLLSVPSLGWARQAAAAPASAAARERPPFAKNVLGLEIGAGLFLEAWNFNHTHETVGEGTFAVSWAFTEGKALIVEYHAAGITQARPRTAFLNGIMPAIRCRVLTRGTSTMFIDLGAGVSWSDTNVPPDGTHFNYLIAASLGMTRRLSGQVYLVASARLLHVSNASLKGRNRNPDIEALGGYVGVFVGF